MVNKNSGDSIAFAMLDIMNSDEHKKIFKKQAQIPKNPDMTLGGDKKEENAVDYSSLAKKPGQFSTEQAKNYGAGGNVAGKHQPNAPTGISAPNPNPIAKRSPAKPTITGVDPTGKVSDQEMATKLLEQKANQGNEIAKGLLAGQMVPASDVEEMGLNVNDLRAAGYKIASETIVQQIVRIANVLGKKGMFMSEAIADELLNSIILEAKKKTREDKDEVCKKCDSKKCKCEPKKGDKKEAPCKDKKSCK